MHTASSQFDTPGIRSAGDNSAPAVPAWVFEMIGPCTKLRDGNSDIHAGSQIALLSLTHHHASQLPSAEFRAASAGLYQRARQLLAHSKIPPHIVRIWNFIPAIHDRMGDDLDRYRVFNQGRFDACADWFSPANFRQALPTATGVGYRGADLTIHFLTSTHPGTPVENPRQRPSFEYSEKFGPRPPCFARATRLDHRLLIGGTASVRGEDSVHHGSLQKQLTETFLNLSSLLNAANSEKHSPPAYSFSRARVYAPSLDRESFPQDSRAAISHYFGPDCDIEYVRGDLCRSELLVEIEALAQCSRLLRHP